MRDEVLKKLDALLGKSVYGEGEHCHCYPMSEFKVLQQWRDWLVLRDELAAERCDACRWWRGTSEPGHVVQRCAYIDTLMYPDACCSHFLALREDFEKKEPV